MAHLIPQNQKTLNEKKNIIIRNKMNIYFVEKNLSKLQIDCNGADYEAASIDYYNLKGL